MHFILEVNIKMSSVSFTILASCNNDHRFDAVENPLYLATLDLSGSSTDAMGIHKLPNTVIHARCSVHSSVQVTQWPELSWEIITSTVTGPMWITRRQ